MSERPDDDELQDLREEKMEKLQDQAEQQQDAQEARQQQAEAQKKAILRKHLTDDARKRLNAVEMSKPEFAQQVQQQVIALARSGRIQGKIDEDKMKQILEELKPDDDGYNIRRR